MLAPLATFAVAGLVLALARRRRTADRPSAHRTFTFAYPTFRGSTASHHATLRLPVQQSAPLPVLVNVHGGFWKTKWSLQNLPTSTLLGAFDNCATWDVEYARVDQEDPAASPEGGGFPHTCLDVLAALNALGDGVVLPAELRSRLDLSRVYLCGHSAGGQIVLWLGLLSRLSPSQRAELAAPVGEVAGTAAAAAVRAGLSATVGIRGVIALAAVTCLDDALAEGYSPRSRWTHHPHCRPTTGYLQAICAWLGVGSGPARLPSSNQSVTPASAPA